MLDNFTGIKIQGANFEEETDLQFFKDTENPAMSLVYGKNGAGKSTISRGFSAFTGKLEESIHKCWLIGLDGNEIEVSDEEKRRIHIFNEDYIDKNIRIEEDALGTIVVLGKRTDLEDLIKESQKNVKEKQADYDAREKVYNELNDPESEKSLEYINGQLVNLLRGESNWAGRDAKIKGNTRASSVKADTYKSFITQRPKSKRDILIIEYNEKLKELDEARKGSKRIEKEVRISKNFCFDEAQYLELLAKDIQKPNLSDREKYIISLSSQKGHDYVDGIKRFFNKSEAKRCPFCLQEVSNEYKEELFMSIEKALSKEAKDHRDLLNNIHLEIVEYDFNAYAELEACLIDECKGCIIGFNQKVDEINGNVHLKIDDVYTPIISKEIKIKESFDRMIEQFDMLEKARIEYNKSAVEVDSKIEELNRINSEITYYDIIQKYNELKSREVENADVKKLLDEIQKTLTPLKKELQGYIDEKKNAKIALKKINNGLSYIFFAKDRLSIEYKNDKYYLKSRGKDVSPKKISAGERNAIAICYFFSEIMKNQDEDVLWLNNYIFVIDDPISSFDMENRVGIMSYIKYQLLRFEKGNSNSKTIILTHDLQTAFDVEKIYEEVKFAVAGNKRGIKSYELRNNVFDKLVSKSKNEYSTLICDMYLYAIGEKPEYELVAGNSMRRVVEAYSTFTYKVGIDSLSTNESIMEKIEEPYKTYFENLMYRFVLHGGSHNDDRVKTLNDVNFFDYISGEEKQKTAKEIISFLYLLNSIHINRHLEALSRDDIDIQINSWLVDIKENAIIVA